MALVLCPECGEETLDRLTNCPLCDEPLAEEKQQTKPIINEVAELKVMDPAVGSGHFLLVAFDLLLDMYKEQFFALYFKERK